MLNDSQAATKQQRRDFFFQYSNDSLTVNAKFLLGIGSSNLMGWHIKWEVACGGQLSHKFP